MIHEWLQATDGNSLSVRVFLFDGMANAAEKAVKLVKLD